MGQSYYDLQSLHHSISYSYSCFTWLNGSITLIQAETERYDIVHFSKVTTKSLAREQASRSQIYQVREKLLVNFDPCQDFLVRKQGLCWYADCVTAHLGTFIYEECKRKVQKCLSANRPSFSELFDDISLVLNLVDGCISAV